MRILSVARTGGIIDTYQIDISDETGAMDIVAAVKDGEVFRARIARTVYRNDTYEFVVSTNELPVAYNKKYIVSVLIETPEEHVNRILEGLF